MAASAAKAPSRVDPALVAILLISLVLKLLLAIWAEPGDGAPGVLVVQ